MKIRILILSIFSFILGYSQNSQQQDNFVKDNFIKQEVYIPMRDGLKLFTAVYIPKDISNKNKYPFLMQRTCYSIAPYGENEYRTKLGPNQYLMKDKYIFVFQDVRGRYMSEGTFTNMTPQVERKGKTSVDESTDTYDTIDWLIKNVKGNNGNAGIYGISYPGFYSTASLPNAHPALKAVSPQAPVTDWFMGDDFHHRGSLFVMDAFSFMGSFGVPRPNAITPDKGPKGFQFPIQDNYRFYLEAGSVKNLKDKYFADSIQFWNDLFKHPNLDTFWKARLITPHLIKVKPAVMVVGGFFDAEDAYGTFATYKAIEKQNPGANNILVAGPWFHGGWVRSDGSYFGDITFGKTTSIDYQQQYELPFFKHYLKGEGTFNPAEANIFVTGSNEWKKFASWPPKDVETKNLYLQPNGKLNFEKVGRTDSWDEYVSDPNKPVPYQDGIQARRTREYMIDDQRFASRRPDVQSYETDALTHDITLTGPVLANLVVSTTGTDADYVVKLIDVYPEDAPNPTPNPKNLVMGGYQMLVRGEIMRGKYRNSFEKPEPFVPGVITKVNYPLPDVAHTFKKGHKIMIQIQNSWFPLADRNPQKFMDIYQAEPGDFQKATQKIYHDAHNSSFITISVLK